MASLDRAYWLCVLLCVYTGAASIASAGFSPTRVVAAAAVPLGLALLWRFAHEREKRADSGVESRALRALRAAGAGVAIWALSRMGEPQVATLELVGALGLGTSAVAAVYAMARIPAAPGLLQAPKSTRSIDAAAFAGFLWSVALVVAAHDLLIPGSHRLDPLTVDYAVTAASIGTLLILSAASLRLRWVRGLELGTGDRALGALVFSLTALAVAIPVAAMNIGPPDRVLPLASCVASLSVLACVVAVDAGFIAMALRATMVVVSLGVPVALLAGSLARATPDLAGPIVLSGCALAVLVGLIARSAARPLGPEQSRWLSALSNASVAALVPEPQQAITATLRALKGTSPSPEARPQLWRLDPPSVLSVNVAGTLEEHDRVAPSLLVELGEREPQRTLRVEVLRALEVRRPEVRPLLEWFEVQKAFSATIIVDEEGPSGFLLLPSGGRTDVMTLEEARAARQLADRISSLLSVTSALERARRRQLEAQASAEKWERSFRRVQGVLEGAAERHRETAKAIARPLVVASYSAAVRLLFAEMERTTAQAQVVVLVTPPGVAAEAWAARLHLEWGSSGPLFCVDAGTEDARDASRWKDPMRSPVLLSEGGTLFIRDVALLSVASQTELVEAFTSRWEERGEGSAAPRLVLGVRTHPRHLESLKMLGRWMAKHVFELPTLAQRPEDLRALILDLASRTLRGSSPLGVERPALQALLDHTWPGNEAELRDTIDRASAVAVGPTITLSDLAAISFVGASSAAPTAVIATSREARPDHRPRSQPPRSRRGRI